MGGVSSALDPSRGRGVISIPDGYTTPSFPSLYIPTLYSTTSQRGVFIYEAEAIWHFTLYWTLLLIGSLFLICSLFASFTMLLNTTVYRPSNQHDDGTDIDTDFLPRDASDGLRQNIPLSEMNPKPASGGFDASAQARIRNNTRRKRKRPPLWPILILPAVATFLGAGLSLISGTVVGFALAAVYSAGGFSMSTWVPFLWACIQVLILIISSYSTLTSIL